MKRIFFLFLLLSSTLLKAQDVIVTSDGSTIICKVIEVGTSEVKYKKISNLDGPLYSILISDINTINYENGEKERYGEYLTTKDSKAPKVSNRQDIILNYGTEIPIQIVSPIKARDVSEGQEVSFRTVSDVVVNGEKLIPASTPVKGIVYKADKSAPFGTKGKLGITIDYLTLLDGTRIPLKGDVYVTGKSRAVLSVLLFLFVTWPACFICGTKAQLLPGYETMVRLGATVKFPVEGKPVVIGQQKLDRIDLSTLGVPKLPCKATITDIHGNKDRVQIEKVSKKKNMVKFKLLNKEGKTDYNGKLYFYQENDIHSIEFENL